MTYDEAVLIQPYWNPVVKELQKRIESEMNALRVCATEELKRIQTRIKVYEELKTLPADVLAMFENKQA